MLRVARILEPAVLMVAVPVLFPIFLVWVLVAERCIMPATTCQK